MKIGERRDKKPETTLPGPGYYQPSLNQTQHSTPAASFTNKTGRKSDLLSPANGPGSYLGNQSSFSN